MICCCAGDEVRPHRVIAAHQNGRRAIPARRILNVRDISIKFAEDRNREISPVFLKRHVTLSLKQLFGEIGAKARADVIKYDPKESRFVLRCDDRDYVRLRASLSCANSYEGQTCFYDVTRATQNLLSLTADSRSFVH